MQKTYNKIHFFFVYIVFSAIFFVMGLTLCYSIPIDSFIYSGLEENFIKGLDGIKDSAFFSLTNIIPVFLAEMKYVLFIIFASFTKHRGYIFPALVSFKGFVIGISVACLMRSIKFGNVDVEYEFLFCSVFVILSVCLISVICWLSATSLLYTDRLIFPLKINLIIKRKDTYAYLLDILAVCGALFIIVLLKIGNFKFMIS